MRAINESGFYDFGRTRSSSPEGRCGNQQTDRRNGQNQQRKPLVSFCGGIWRDPGDCGHRQTFPLITEPMGATPWM